MIFDFETGPKRFAVMGDPVAHSKSPRIHQLFAAQFGIRLEYLKIQVDPGGFPQAVDQFRANGGKGLNVTVPYKLEAWRLVDRRSPRAEIAGAVNTIRFDNDGLYGDNTDGAGLARDLLENLQAPLAGKSVLVVGAGGAVRGVLGPLLDARPLRLVVANRTAEKARELAVLFDQSGTLEASGLDDLAGRRFDIVINGTAASLHGEVPPLPSNLFTAGGLAYDMMYADRPTPFMEWARSQGAARVADGLGMLVEQAAESFFLWHGRRPQTAPVIADLRPLA